MFTVVCRDAECSFSTSLKTWKATIVLTRIALPRLFTVNNCWRRSSQSTDCSFVYFEKDFVHQPKTESVPVRWRETVKIVINWKRCPLRKEKRFCWALQLSSLVSCAVSNLHKGLTSFFSAAFGSYFFARYVWKSDGAVYWSWQEWIIRKKVTLCNNRKPGGQYLCPGCIPS